MKQINIVVSGKVQGVFFRKNTKIKADEFGITGRIWNNDDGTVEIIAQGEEKKLKNLFEWAQKGEGMAIVEGIEYKYQQIREVYDDFEIILF